MKINKLILPIIIIVILINIVWILVNIVKISTLKEYSIESDSLLTTYFTQIDSLRLYAIIWCILIPLIGAILITTARLKWNLAYLILLFVSLLGVSFMLLSANSIKSDLLKFFGIKAPSIYHVLFKGHP